MTRFGLALMSLGVVGAVALSGCGSAEKEKELQSKLDACSADKQKLEARVAELEAAAGTPMASPTPEASPMATAASGKATPKKTAAPAATTATPPPTPTPTPTLPTNIKLPGKLPGKK